ncbi:AAA family ATPase [Streptomyces sp. NBC_01498]|uniref:shikimate kinase n=1 Tax=Streptomyces sp. NBC_01498 TaxID=2975870 RepID=UPI002E7B4048|nr:shikimate kinase [Streptomyces sp. NBC_01498]WTL25964.1 AAA family ATPase [Streptomyces sp. NBC_01498]
MPRPRPTTARTPWMVLTGPAGAGKTTIGHEIAARTGRPFVDLDATGEEYYAEAGWSLTRLRDRITAVGRLTAEAEWEPARAHAVARATTDHPDAVLALGAGHTTYTDHRHTATVRTTLRRCPNVVRLLPSPDRETSLAVLRERCWATKGHSWLIDGHDFLAQWLDDHTTERIATRTLYTGDETPTETAARLLRSS